MVDSRVQSRLRILHGMIERHHGNSVDTEFKYTYVFNNRNAGVRRVDAETRTLLMRQFYEICERIDVDGETDELSQQVRELGRALTQVLLSPEVEERLGALGDGEVLLLETTDTNLPWELAVVEGEPLCVRTVVARELPGGDDGGDDNGGAEINVVLVGDPQENLPGARRETSAVEAVLRDVSSSVSAPRLQIQSLSGFDATKRAVLMESLLSPDGADVFHFAGHVSFDADDDARSALKLHGTDVKAFEVSRLGRRPLVFVNGCRSQGASAAAAQAADIGSIEGMAGQFIAGGARAYLGTFWALDDELGATFAAAYYSRLAAGGTIGDAYRDGQQSIRAVRPGAVSALGYILFGSPHERLWESPVVLATGPYVNADGIRAIIELEREFNSFEALIVEDLPWVLWSDVDIEAWTARLPLSLDERHSCQELLLSYREEFGSLIRDGLKRMQCVLLMGEFRRYLNRLTQAELNDLAKRIEDLATSGALELCLLDSQGMEELEVVAKVRDARIANAGEAVYVFNKQTRFESDVVQYYLYRETEWSLVSQYIKRFDRAFAAGNEFTLRMVGATRESSDCSPTEAVAGIVRTWRGEGT